MRFASSVSEFDFQASVLIEHSQPKRQRLPFYYLKVRGTSTNCNMTVVPKAPYAIMGNPQTYGEIIMGISDVCSPVTRKGSKVGSGPLGLSPGARSDPGRRDQTEAPSVEPELQRR